MMKKHLFLLFLLLSATVLVACDPNQTAKNDLAKLTERIETKSADWSAADWDDALLAYNEICQTIERYEYTDEELREIGRLKGKCSAMFLQHQVKQSIDDAKPILKELEGAVDGFLEAITK